MLALQVIVDGDGCWSDLKSKEIIHVTDGLHVAGLAKGMKGGAPSIAIRVDLPDGRVVIAETSLKLFLTAADMLKARYGDPRV